MRPVPIPDGMAEAMGGRRVVIGEDDPTRDDVRPCEYVVTDSALYPGMPCVTALIALDQIDRVKIVAGGQLSLTLDGGELPWSLAVEDVPVDVPSLMHNLESAVTRAKAARDRRLLLERLTIVDPWSFSREGLDDVCMFCDSENRSYIDGKYLYVHADTCPWIEAVGVIGRPRPGHFTESERRENPR